MSDTRKSRKRIPILRDPLKEWTKVIGEIVGVHGLRGAVKIAPATELLARFAPGNQVCLVSPTERRILVTIEDCEIKGNRVTLKLTGVDSVEEAERLIGWQLAIHPDTAPSLAEGEFLVSDVLGMIVVTVDGREVGPVIEVEHTPAHDLYVTPRGLIPATKQFVKEIDWQSRRIVVDVPNGLLEWG